MSNSAGMPGSRPWGGVGTLMVVAFLVPLAWSGIDRLQVDFSDRPDNSSAEIARQSSAANRLLVGWNNATLEDARIPLLQERLLGTRGEDGIRRGGSPYVASVTTPVDRLRQIIDQGVEPETAYASLVGSLIGPGKLNVTLTEAGRLTKDQTIRMIGERGLGELGIDLRVSPRTIAFFPEEGDTLFESISVKIPDGVPTSISNDHDVELTWDGIHDPAKVQGVQKMLSGLVGYPTAEFPDGVPLVKSAERRAGLPVALEIRLTPAGLIAPAAALEEIRERASGCRIPSNDMLFVGAAVTPAAQHQGMLSALAVPVLTEAVPAGVGIPAAALLILAGVLLAGLRNPGRVLSSLCLTSVVLLITVGGFGLAGIPFNLLAAYGFLAGIAASLTLLIGASAPLESAEADQRGHRSAALVLFAASAVMMAVPSPSLRTAAIAMAAMTALTFALLETNLLPVSLPSFERAAGDDVSFLLTGPGRWIGRSGLLLVALAAAGLWFARPNLNLGRQLAEIADLSVQTREANDVLAGTNLLEATIRFDRSALDRLRFLERMEVIRGIESDLRKLPGVTGVFSAADLHPSKKVGADASQRERVTFNRLSKTMEEKFRGETSAEHASLVSFGAASTAKGPTDETWTIRVQGDATASLDGLLKQLGSAIPQRIRLEPGVHHQIAGAPLAHAAQVRGTRLSLIIILAASLVVSTVVVTLLLADLPAALAVTLPSYLCQAAILGTLALAGIPLGLLTILSANVAALLALSSAARIVCGARQRMIGHQSASTALGAVLCESSRSLVSLTIALAGAAIAAGLLSSGFLGEAAFVSAAGLVVGLMGTLVIVPTLAVGSLERSARSKESDGTSEHPAAEWPPLRRTA